MSRGAYLRENKKGRVAGLPPEDEQKQRRAKGHRGQRGQQRILIAVIIVLLLILIGMTLFLNRDPLTGIWNMDEITVYEFEGNGKGTMILPSSEYAFTYQVKDDTLYIDFIDERAKDAEYRYYFDGDRLILNGGNTTTQGEYVCTKSKGK